MNAIKNGGSTEGKILLDSICLRKFIEQEKIEGQAEMSESMKNSVIDS